MSTIDLRSDTTTRPTEAMRAAMASAAVGDDGYAEDPTVTQLEAQSAARLGKAAGLYLPSGTLSNLVAALAHTEAGQRSVMMTNSHIAATLTYEARIATLTDRTLVPDTGRGIADLDAIRAAIAPATGDRAGLLCIENTHNQAGGSALLPTETQLMSDIGHEYGIPVHLDGARIFNAEVALGIPVAELAAGSDSVTFCLSKGLAAPIGSMLCGSQQFIDRARKYRQYTGGTMRQAGIPAAAGIVALETMVARLADDHVSARILADGFAAIPGVTLPYTVETNLVYIDVAGTGLTASEVAERLAVHGVLIGDFYNATLLRAVTHLDVTAADCHLAVAALADVVASA